MAGNEPFKKNGLGFAKLFCGREDRKTETNVFEIRRDFGFRPAGGRGRNAGRRFLQDDLFGKK